MRSCIVDYVKYSQRNVAQKKKPVNYFRLLQSLFEKYNL